MFRIGFSFLKIFEQYGLKANKVNTIERIINKYYLIFSEVSQACPIRWIDTEKA